VSRWSFLVVVVVVVVLHYLLANSNGNFVSLSTIDLPSTFTAAPSGPPLNFSVEAITPRTLYFSWELPLLEHQNGVILDYVLNISSDDNGMIIQIYSNGNATNISATLFTPYTVYRCKVAASTLPGTGPYSDEVLILTPEDGKSNGFPQTTIIITLPSDMYCKSHHIQIPIILIVQHCNTAKVKFGN